MINLTTKQIEKIEKLGGTVHLEVNAITFDVKNQVYGEHCKDEERIWNEIQDIVPEIDGALQGNPWNEGDMSQIYFKLD